LRAKFSLSVTAYKSKAAAYSDIEKAFVRQAWFWKQAAFSTSREVGQAKRFAQDIAAGMKKGRREWQRRLTGMLSRADKQIRHYESFKNVAQRLSVADPKYLLEEATCLRLSREDGGVRPRCRLQPNR
jgi:hypothetical protein